MMFVIHISRRVCKCMELDDDVDSNLISLFAKINKCMTHASKIQFISTYTSYYILLCTHL